mmetsp:Transcript_71629/g.133907  ORF Transcript_71629/g.133907 Transcript_71629/m.133907 type:complete len:128 (-) Transcript_71629:257-640(-)
MALAFRALRFARCRNAVLSSWARRVNATFDSRRGMASVAMLQMAAETHTTTTLMDGCRATPCFAEATAGESATSDSDLLQAIIESALGTGLAEHGVVDLHNCNSRTCLVPTSLSPVMTLSEGYESLE